MKGRYVCSAHRRKGPAVCPSTLVFSAEALNAVFLDALEDTVLSPSFIDDVVRDAFAFDVNAERASYVAERAQLTREIDRLTQAIASTGGEIASLADALKTRDARVRALDGLLSKTVLMPDRDTLRAALEQRCADWRDILRGQHLDQARMVLQHLLALPIVIHNQPKPKWVATAKPDGLTVGYNSRVTSLMPGSWNRIAFWLEHIDGLRQAA